jgi:hypothetical protein
MRIFLLFAAALFLSGNARAQALAARQVRFLPLGELPPFRQEVRDGVRHELEPPAGSIPPREVVLGFDGDLSEGIPLRLGQTSAPLTAPPGAGPLLVRRREDTPESEPWLRLTRPEAGDFLVLLWRESRQGTWEKARSLVLPDGAGDAPAGSVRFVNCSPATIGILIGQEKLLLVPGKSFRRDVVPGQDRVFEVHLADTTGGVKRLHAGAILQNPGERTLVLVYQADGAAARRPLKVVVRREPAPPPVPPR